MNFAATHFMVKSSVRMESADVHLIRNFSDSHTTVPHHHNVQFSNDLVISAFSRQAGTWFAIHRCSAIFKLIAPLKLCDADNIVTESRLNLTNGFHLAVAQFLAKLVAVASFHHFTYNENPTRALNTTSLKCCINVIWRSRYRIPTLYSKEILWLNL